MIFSGQIWSFIFCSMINFSLLIAIWSNAPPRSILVTIITPYEQEKSTDQIKRSRILVLLANGTACARGRKSFLKTKTLSSFNQSVETRVIEDDDLKMPKHPIKQITQTTNQTTHESEASKLEKKDMSVVTDALNEKSDGNIESNEIENVRASSRKIGHDYSEMGENQSSLTTENTKSNSTEKEEIGYTDQMLISKPLYFVEAVRIVDGILLCGVENVTVVNPLIRVRKKFECYTWHKGTPTFQKVIDTSAINSTYVGFSPTPQILFAHRPLILVSTIRDEASIGNPSRIVQNEYALTEDHIYALVRTDNYEEEPEDMFIVGKFETPNDYRTLMWRIKQNVTQPPNFSQLKGIFLCGVMFKLKLHLFDIQNERYWRYKSTTEEWFKNEPVIKIAYQIEKRLFPACGIYRNNLVYGGGIKVGDSVLEVKTKNVAISWKGDPPRRLEQCDPDSIRRQNNITARFNNLLPNISSCKALNSRSSPKFDRNVYRYSFMYSKWDVEQSEPHKFEKMKNERMLYRLATLSDGKKEYLTAVLGRTKTFQDKNSVDIFIRSNNIDYWITEKIRGLPKSNFSSRREELKWNQRFNNPRYKNDTMTGEYDFATVVIPAAWLPSCNHKIEWNNHEMLPHGRVLSIFPSLLVMSISLIIFGLL